MSISAVCPECHVAATVPGEMSGKKVRCKKCQAVFVVAAPKSRGKRPVSKPVLSSSVIAKRPAKKSNAVLWLSVILVALLGIGGLGAAAWIASQSDDAPKPHAKAKAKKLPAADETAKHVDESETKPAKGKAGKTDPAAKAPTKTPPAEAKKLPPPETKERAVEPTVVSPLAASTPIEVKDLSAVRAVVPVGNYPDRAGLLVAEGAERFFDMYDLKKQEKIGRIKLAPDVELVDVDPEGAVVASSTADRRFNVFAFPGGALLEDEWNPYDNAQDKLRFLVELGGKVNHIALVSKTELWVMTSGGFGDLWDVPSKKDSKYLIRAPQREDFRKLEVEPNRDFVLSPDRTKYAYATNDGIQFHEARTDKRLGSTGKLTKYGTKPDLVGMGFDPAGTKLGAYLSAGGKDGRVFWHATFGVPGGEELSAAVVPDPGMPGGIAFVNGEHYFTFDRGEAKLWDGKGRTVAEGRINARSSQFAPRVVHSHVLFTYLNEKGRPAVGSAHVPLGGAVAPPPPPPKVDTAKAKSVLDLFAPDEPAAPVGEPTKVKTFEHQEVWEFGPRGIVKTGVRSTEARAEK